MAQRKGTTARSVCVASLGKSTLWMKRTSMTTRAVEHRVHLLDLLEGMDCWGFEGTGVESAAGHASWPRRTVVELQPLPLAELVLLLKRGNRTWFADTDMMWRVVKVFEKLPRTKIDRHSMM